MIINPYINPYYIEDYLHRNLKLPLGSTRLASHQMIFFVAFKHFLPGIDYFLLSDRLIKKFGGEF